MHLFEIIFRREYCLLTAKPFFWHVHLPQFSLIAGLIRYLFSKTEINVLILGLDYAGKTVRSLSNLSLLPSFLGCFDSCSEPRATQSTNLVRCTCNKYLHKYNSSTVDAVLFLSAVMFELRFIEIKVHRI